MNLPISHVNLLVDGDASREEARGRMVGRVVWRIATADFDPTTRSLFLVTSLSPQHLLGLSVTAPANPLLRLAIDPGAAPDVLSALPEEHRCDTPAVRLRNLDARGVVLIAPQDAHRQDVGSSLGHVPVLDRAAIQGATQAWLAEMLATFPGTIGPEKSSFMEAMIEGLAASEATKSLDQFAEVLHGFVADPGLEFAERLRRTCVVLRLPLNSYARAPAPDASKFQASAFRSMFREAERELANLPFLTGTNQRPLDRAAIAARVTELRAEEPQGERDTPLDALQLVDDLLSDHAAIRPGVWRPSQQAFCAGFDWQAHGKKVFEARATRVTKNLAETTRDFLHDEHSDAVTDGDRALLSELEADCASEQALEQFFERHHVSLLENRKLHNAWRQRLFPESVENEPDLLAALLRGIVALLVKEADAENGWIDDSLRIVIGARGAGRVSTWKALDRGTADLFRLEMRLLVGALGEVVELDLGKWLDPNALEGMRDSTAQEAQSIDLELRLRRGDGSLGGTMVRVVWRPSAGKARSIALSLPMDLERLKAGLKGERVQLRRETIVPKGRGEAARLSLRDVASFDDVAGGDKGRTADPLRAGEGEEWFGLVRCELDRLHAEYRITAAQRDGIEADLDAFHAAFTGAVLAMLNEPGTAYATVVIPDVASTFGALCLSVRQALQDDAEGRRSLLPLICEFGIARSATSAAVAIVPAWHPLRLQERRARAMTAGSWLRDVLSDERTTSKGIERGAGALLRALGRWHLPEIVKVDHKDYACIEDVGGYSLAVPVERASAAQALDASARAASEQFMRVAEEYLRLNPHQESNFATAIYNADSVELPRLLATALESRMEGREHVRCGLLITHDDASQIRQTFALQNARLQGRTSNLDGGFLSRLRVGVRSNAPSSDGARQPDIDVLFLHEAFFQQSKLVWQQVDGSADRQPMDFDLLEVLRPRRRLAAASHSSKSLEIVLAPEDIPSAAAHYLDLCYATDGAIRVIAPDRRAVPVRQVTWGEATGAVRRIIENAHDMAEWVVSFDRLSSQAMLIDAGIKVIRDVMVPNLDARILVSSRRPSANLLRLIRGTYAAMPQPEVSQDPDDRADRTVAAVVNACGQKVMAAARSTQAAREIMGLAAAIALVRAAPETGGRPVMWFSLDDARAFFGLKGALADALALSIEGDVAGGFRVLITVVEAKCVAEEGAVAEAKGSLAQVTATSVDLADKLVDPEDPALRRAWGVDLLGLLSAKPEFARAFAVSADREAFERALAAGLVQFELIGRSVVAVHDDQASSAGVGTEAHGDTPAIVQHRLGQRAFARLIASLDGVSPAPSIAPFAGWDDVGATSSRNPESPPTAAPAENPSAGPEAHASETDEAEPSVTEVAVPPPVDVVPVPTNVAPSEASGPFRIDLLAVLQEIASRSGAADEEEERRGALRLAKRLQVAFVSFDMKADLADDPVAVTPNGVIVRFKGSNSLTMKRIESKLSELRTTHGLDVRRIMEGLGEIGIFVAAPARRVVDLAKTWLDVDWPETAPDQLSSFLIGLREDTGDPLWLNLDAAFGGNDLHNPHTLIAGETGSGKGVLTAGLILQMIALNDPRKLQLHLIDPKHGVDFHWLDGAPHLVGGIVTSQEEAEAKFEEVIAEMERRYALFGETKSPNIKVHNSRVPEPERLPRVLVIHDEMADWMSDSKEYREMIQGKVTRLASKARAAGIHIVLITQRASNDAIPVGIRDNLGNRIVLRVAGEAGSRLALKTPGAETLLDKGHVAAILGSDRPKDGPFFVAQVPFASPEDMQALAEQAIRSFQR